MGKSFDLDQRDRKISAEQIRFNKIKTKEASSDDEFVRIKEYKNIKNETKKDNQTDQPDEDEVKPVRKSNRARRREELAKLRSKETTMLKELGKDAVMAKNDEIIDRFAKPKRKRVKRNKKNSKDAGEKELEIEREFKKFSKEIEENGSHIRDD